MCCREGRADPEMRSAKRTTLCRALQSWFVALLYHTEMHWVSPAKPESALIMPAKPESALARPAKPESPARMATTPADAPLWPGLITSVLDPPLVSVRAAGIPWSAPSQELAESAPQLVPPSSPSSPLVPPSSPSLRVLSSLVLSERPRDPASPECPLTFAPPECPLEVVEFPKNFLGGELPAIAHWDPKPAMAHGVPWFILAAEALDLPWPPKLPASVLETICALSASCVSVSSRSQSLPGVSSALPWWAPVSSAPPWWAPDLPESPHASADLPESPHASADLPESPHASADLPESPHASADLPESPHVSAVSFAPHGPGPPFPPPVPPPLHRPPGLCFVWSVWKPLFGGGAWIWLPLTTSLAPHYSCT